MKSSSIQNKQYYDYIKSRKKFIDGSPHLKHKILREYYMSLVKSCCDYVRSIRNDIEYVPHVLDLGAGDDTATLSFILEGCAVTAVDISVEQLNRFKEAYPDYVNQCNVICADVDDYMEVIKNQYDIIVFNSFLHHIPDYISLIGKSINHLSNHGNGGGGVIFTFQDPIYYPTLSKFQLNFSKVSYFSWRVTQGDLFEGIKRRMKRNRGDFSNPTNDIEYHVVRDGVNQNEIIGLLEKNQFDIEYHPYFSTQSPVFQWLGSRLGIKNTFSIVAKQ